MRPPAVMANVRDVDPYTVEIAELRDHLGLVFHRFINGIAKGRSKVTIAINGDSVRPNNPVEHPLTRPHDQRQIQCQINDETSTTILLQAFVLPTEAQIRQQHTPDGELVVREEMNRLSLGGRMNASQGLYFYRLDRLIKWGGWCDVYTEDEHTKLLRVTVDFDRAADDLMKVNISKREVQLSVKLREALKNAVKDGRADARSRYSGKVPKSMGPSTNGDASTTTQTNVDKGKISKPNDQSNGSTGESRRPTGEPSNQVKIRIVASKQRWQQSKGFLGETTMEVSEEIVSLVSLTKAIENNTEAKKALIEFLAYLDGQSNA